MDTTEQSLEIWESLDHRIELLREVDVGENVFDGVQAIPPSSVAVREVKM
jgi:hypothetical protein